MTVGVRDVARRAQPHIQPIVLSDAPFVAIDDASDFFREGGCFRSQTEWRVVTHLVIRHADKDPAADQQQQRESARHERPARAQVNRRDSFFASYCLHCSMMHLFRGGLPPAISDTSFKLTADRSPPLNDFYLRLSIYDSLFTLISRTFHCNPTSPCQ